MIDTLRTLLSEFDQVDSFEQYNTFLPINSSELAVVEWLWVNAAFTFHGSELVSLRALLARRLACSCLWVEFLPNNESTQLLIRLTGPEMLELYMQGRYTLLSAFCQGPASKSIDSACDGLNFLNLLSGMGLDVELCILQELDNPPQNFQRGGQKVVFEKFDDGIMVLRWEWAYDPSAPGYHVVSEFNALAGDAVPDHYISE
jgi:hypothetical protein